MLQVFNAHCRVNCHNIIIIMSRFIGELFKIRVLSVRVMHQCIIRLLAQPEDEESLEALCLLLSTIGKELENLATTTSGRSASNSVIIFF